MDNFEIAKHLRNIAGALEDTSNAIELKELLDEKMGENHKYERVVAELLYGFITLNEMNMRSRSNEVPPNGYPAEKHLKVLSKITNPDRVNSQTVKQVEEAYMRIFDKKLVLGETYISGIKQDERIIKE